MRKKQCIAMLLAGGQGSRLGILTKAVAKPAVPFGGKYRIIDFPLSNCSHSGIDVVGVLTQYQPLELNRYIGSGQPWGLDLNSGGVYVLPPYVKGQSGEWYRGTANAIYQNISFVEQFSPDYVLVLSGDHIYKMNYNRMLEEHIASGADATIAVRRVAWEEANRFGIMETDEDGRIVQFEEKPVAPKSNQASMGVYVFTWPVLKRYLMQDASDPKSKNDFGKNIIPAMLGDDRRLMAHGFDAYWKDVGTIESLWEANMDLLTDPPAFDLRDKLWRIYARNPVMPPHFVGEGAEVARSLVTEGAVVYGTVRHSVIFAGVLVEKGAQVLDSVVMPGARICAGAVLRHAIVGENAVIAPGCLVGDDQPGGPERRIALVGQNAALPEGYRVLPGEQVDADVLAMERG
ncbi:MAG: glucose-1-phosphate adenylyltransferase [Clostridiales bacterium]|nr:glucose-1-phosphate adenylyltransferase [Clostridiales bacterium]